MASGSPNEAPLAHREASVIPMLLSEFRQRLPVLRHEVVGMTGHARPEPRKVLEAGESCALRRLQAKFLWQRKLLGKGSVLSFPYSGDIVGVSWERR
jgi:hypothetical protein